MIRVAIEGSFQGTFYRVSDLRGGIYRTTHELLVALAAIGDLDLRLVALDEQEVLKASLHTSAYAAMFGIPFSFSARSRLGIAQLYWRTFMRVRKAEHARASRMSPLRLVASLGTRLLWRLHHQWHVDRLTPALAAGIDIYHSPFPAFPSRHRTGKAVRILTIYDLIPVRAPELVPVTLHKLFKEILNSIDRERDWIITISEFSRQEICEWLKIDPRRVRVTHLAAGENFHPVEDELERQAVKERYRISGPYLLSIATLQPRKNLQLLIRCFFDLLARRPSTDLQLVLVGFEGFQYEEIIQEASSRVGSEGRVVFTGFVPDADLSALYSSALAFVFPSYYEGFGLPPLEAMKCGTPVITANNTSLPEVVGDAGLMVNPHDGLALTAAMERLVGDPSLREVLRIRGLARARTFSWERCAAETAEVYRAAVRER